MTVQKALICRNEMEDLLLRGTHLVLDRYVYSGVAYSAAKGIPGMDRSWCAASDSGLIAPDAVIFLHMDPSMAESRYGLWHVIGAKCRM